MKKHKWFLLFVAFFTLLGLSQRVHAEALTSLPFSGEYTSTANNAIKAIHFEGDKVVLSFVDDLKTDMTKNTQTYLDFVGPYATSFKNASKEEQAQLLKSFDASAQAVFYFPEAPGYQSSYGKYYLVLNKADYQKVDSQYVIKASQKTVNGDNLTTFQFLFTEDKGQLRDAQGGLYQKAFPTLLLVCGGVVVILILGLGAFYLKKKKQLA